MEITIYGLLVTRQVSASILSDFEARKPEPPIRFWKSWPDGSRCRVLTVNGGAVADYRALAAASVLPRGIVQIPPPWYPTGLRGGRWLTFDPERDWWVAPRSIRSIVLRTSREIHRPEILEVTPRRDEA